MPFFAHTFIPSECVRSVLVVQIEELRLLLQLADGPDEKAEVTNQLKALLKSPSPQAPSISDGPLAAPHMPPSTPRSAGSSSVSTSSPAYDNPPQPTPAASIPVDAEAVQLESEEVAEDLLGDGGFES